MSVTGLREELLALMQSIKTVDCHSHTRFKKTYYDEGPFGLFNLSAYFQRDIVSTAGDNLYEGIQSDQERWELLKGVLQKSRNVTYWRHNMVMYKNLFGFKDDELNDNNWHDLDRLIKNRNADPDWYHQVTVNRCKLETQVRNINWFEDWEEEYFTGILRMEGAAIAMQNRDSYDRLAAHLSLDISDLKSARDAVIRLLMQYIDKGIRGIKLGHAYGRTLHSEPVSEQKAEELFDRFMKNGGLQGDDLKQMQDYWIYFLADQCRINNLVFQIHTGVQTNWGIVPDSDPLLLIPLLQAFKEVKFDLFHAGYPYSRELGILGKHYPNVYLNMAWMYLISTAASRQILSEWIDLVPGYRILAFGSDVGYPEFIYGHLLMARECMADVLVEKIQKDYMSMEEARSLIQKTFRDNALELYRL